MQTARRQALSLGRQSSMQSGPHALGHLNASCQVGPRFAHTALAICPLTLGLHCHNCMLICHLTCSSILRQASLPIPLLD